MTTKLSAAEIATMRAKFASDAWADVQRLLEYCEAVERENAGLMREITHLRQQVHEGNGSKMMDIVRVMDNENANEVQRLRMELRKTNRGVERQAHREAGRLEEIANLRQELEMEHIRRGSDMKTFAKHFEMMRGENTYLRARMADPSTTDWDRQATKSPRSTE